MKAPLLVLVLVLCSLLLPPLVDSQPEVTSSSSNNTNTNGVQQQQQQRLLADTLTPRLYNAPTLDQNQCSSTLGIAMAFALVLSSNETRAEFDSVGLSIDYSTWRTTANALEAKYNGTCLNASCQRRGPIVSFANAVWTQANRTLSPAYVAYIAGGGAGGSTSPEQHQDEDAIDHDAAVAAAEVLRALDFADETAGATINDWVNASTNGLIKSIVPDGPLSSSGGIDDFVAVNALYFQAAWATAFDQNKVTVDRFYPAPAAATTANNTAATAESTAVFMHRVEELPYAETSTYQVVQLPFMGSDDVSMLIVLEWFSAVTTTSTSLLTQAELVAALLPILTPTPVALALPKFTVRSRYGTSDFRAALSPSSSSSSSGGSNSSSRSDVFAEPVCLYEAPGGDGGGEGESCSTTIQEIIHEAVIEVNEDGVTAAAVTAIVGRSFPEYPAGPVLMLVNRPFQFFLYESTTQLILFEGYVADAAGADDAMPVNVTFSHDQDDFWTTLFGVTPRVGDTVITSSKVPTKAPTPTTSNNNNNNNETTPTSSSSVVPTTAPAGFSSPNNQTMTPPSLAPVKVPPLVVANTTTTATSDPNVKSSATASMNSVAVVVVQLLTTTGLLLSILAVQLLL
jgi:serine protease inhibitor